MDTLSNKEEKGGIESLPNIKKPNKEIIAIHSLIRDLESKIRNLTIKVDEIRREMGLDK